MKNWNIIKCMGVVFLLTITFSKVNSQIIYNYNWNDDWNTKYYSDPCTGCPEYIDSWAPFPVYSIAINGDQLYAGGLFSQASGGLIGWDIGTLFPYASSFPLGEEQVVYEVLLNPWPSSPYVGGILGTNARQAIEEWHSSTPYASDSLGYGLKLSLSAPGDISSAQVNALATSGDLYAGGFFNWADSVAVGNIAVFDGNIWSFLGDSSTGLVINSTVGTGRVYDIVINDAGTKLYAGGDFTTADGQIMQYITEYDIATKVWFHIGSAIALNGVVHALALDENRGASGTLYAGGMFTTAVGTTATNIAQFDIATSTWSPLTMLPSGYEGTNGTVRTIDIACNGDVYIGGDFTTVAGQNINHIAKWIPSINVWGGLGDGTDDIVRTLAIKGNDLFVGGDFSMAGLKMSSYLAHFDLCKLDASLSANRITTTPDETVIFTYTGDDETAYSLDFGDGSSVTDGVLNYGRTFSHTYTGATYGTYNVVLTTTNCGGDCSETIQITVQEASTCCGDDIPVPGIGTSQFSDIGEFYEDIRTGQIIYKKTGCPGEYPMNCTSLPPVKTPLTDVISSSAVTFTDDWTYNEAIYYSDNTDNTNLGTLNIFETGAANKWRPKKQYVYRQVLDRTKKALSSTDPTAYKNHDRGVFPMNLYDWKTEGNNDPDEWVLTSTTNKYSPNGEPTEDENILGIKSTANYGYNHTLPILVAQNAGEGTVSYESFENEYLDGATNPFFENGLLNDNSDGTWVTNANTAWSSPAAHTGTGAIKLKNPGEDDAFVIGDEITITNQTYNEGLLVRVWLQVNPNKTELITNSYNRVQLYYKKTTAGPWYVLPISMQKISDAGQWSLYEGIIYKSNLLAAGFSGNGNNKIRIGLAIDFANYNAGDIYLDDVRIQPLQSEMVCYVYDKAQRLTAVFDDQHYAMIYQYNSEGILVRKLKETTRGIKTISGTQYNTIGTDR